MHPKIRKLAEEANIFMADEGHPGYEYCPNEKEVKKFAELIIRECSKLCDDGTGAMSSMTENTWMNHCRDLILKDFNLTRK